MENEKYCNDCGGENLAYKDNYACGAHYICKDCGKELCFSHEKEEKETTHDVSQNRYDYFEDTVKAMFMFCDPVLNDGKLYISEEKAKEFLLSNREWQEK